jgi:hypothetical protein
MKKILTCNKRIVDELLVQGKLPEEYYPENALEIYESHKDNFPAFKFFYDRSNSIPHYLNVDSSGFPLPEINPYFNKSFYQIAEERALQLLSMGKPINVSWSGGIDSTFVLFTLYKYANDKSQIKVYGTYSSVIESGDIFDRYIKDKFQYDIHTNLEYYENFNIPEDEILVTGCMGNNIFYPEIKTNMPDTWMIFKNPVEDPVKIYWDKPYESVLAENNLEFIDTLIKKCPRKLETIHDLRFWVGFCCNWYSTNSNRYIGIGPDKSKRVYSFFNTDDFQNWALFNKDPQSRDGTYLDERWQLRDFIGEFTNKDFAFSKLNRTSNLSNFGHKWIFLLNDYSNVYLNDLQSPTSVSYK